MKAIIFIVTFSIFLFSCMTTIKNIQVEGLVSDNQSGKPIQGAKVTILSWKPSGFEPNDVDYDKSEVLTDGEGRFIAAFKKGLRLDIGAKADGYLPARSSIDELDDSSVNVSLKLNRIDALHAERITTTIFENVFVGLRDYPAEYNQKRTIPLGINIQQGKSTENQSAFDVWAERDAKNEFPNIVRTPEQGGVVPIFEEDIKHSVLFEKSVAPTDGYLNRYEFKGNEVGFFVKSREGSSYGKLVLKPDKIDIEGHDENGVFREHRIEFKLIYQPNGSTDLFPTVKDVDLEQYLLSSIR